MKILLIIILTALSLGFCLGQEQEGITTIILVRHAEKLDDGTRDPNLSPKGEERAINLKAKFEHTGINAIYSTPYKRTINTVTPLSEAIGIDIQEYNPSQEGFIDAIYTANIGKMIIVSGHSNTTPMAVNELIKSNKYENIDHDQYGRIFIVTVTGTLKTKVLEIQY